MEHLLVKAVTECPPLQYPATVLQLSASGHILARISQGVLSDQAPVVTAGQQACSRRHSSVWQPSA